jgi:hypothetical protein
VPDDAVERETHLLGLLAGRTASVLMRVLVLGDGERATEHSA